MHFLPYERAPGKSARRNEKLSRAAKGHRGERPFSLGGGRCSFRPFVNGGPGGGGGRTSERKLNNKKRNFLLIQVLSG